jgi:hypothetical protein
VTAAQQEQRTESTEHSSTTDTNRFYDAQFYSFITGPEAMSTAKQPIQTKPGVGVGRQSQETTDPSNKPLAATLLQEFQNLKDKFKNEDESTDRGIFIIPCLFVFYFFLYSLFFG